MNILFDLDGTLTDPREGVFASLRYALVGLGVPSPADPALERYVGLPLREIFLALLGSADKDRIESAVAMFRQQFSSAGIYRNTLYPGIDLALARLRELGAVLYVATSRPGIFAKRVLAHLGLTGFFRTVYGSELDGALSNKGDLIAHVLARESLALSDTFMVGDRAHDIVGARVNRMFPIGVLWGYGSRQELVAAGAEVLCERPTGLGDVFSSDLVARRKRNINAADRRR